jgi:hypothetical protein
MPCHHHSTPASIAFLMLVVCLVTAASFEFPTAPCQLADVVPDGQLRPGLTSLGSSTTRGLVPVQPTPAALATTTTTPAGSCCGSCCRCCRLLLSLLTLIGLQHQGLDLRALGRLRLLLGQQPDRQGCISWNLQSTAPRLPSAKHEPFTMQQQIR